MAERGTDLPTDVPEETPVSEHPTQEHPTYEQPAYGPPGADRRDTAVLPDTATVTAAADHGRRSPDLLALVAGVVFCLVAVLGLAGTSLPGWVFGGGLVAVVLVIAGAGLLLSELRRAR